MFREEKGQHKRPEIGVLRVRWQHTGDERGRIRAGEKGIYKGLSEAAIKGIKWADVQGFYRLGKLGLT